MLHECSAIVEDKTCSCGRMNSNCRPTAEVVQSEICVRESRRQIISSEAKIMFFHHLQVSQKLFHSNILPNDWRIFELILRFLI